MTRSNVILVVALCLSAVAGGLTEAKVQKRGLAEYAEYVKQGTLHRLSQARDLISHISEQLDNVSDLTADEMVEKVRAQAHLDAVNAKISQVSHLVENGQVAAEQLAKQAKSTLDAVRSIAGQVKKASEALAEETQTPSVEKRGIRQFGSKVKRQFLEGLSHLKAMISYLNKQIDRASNLTASDMVEKVHSKIYLEEVNKKIDQVSKLVEEGGIAAEALKGDLLETLESAKEAAKKAIKVGENLIEKPTVAKRGIINGVKSQVMKRVHQLKALVLYLNKQLDRTKNLTAEEMVHKVRAKVHLDVVNRKIAQVSKLVEQGGDAAKTLKGDALDTLLAAKEAAEKAKEAGAKLLQSQAVQVAKRG